ncbi:MAG: JAB domain-containing protein [Verrucomicrobiaceae bacterium]|nr:MAG: JAB domain-containing protein [Verrucomicrobiaceae bacterium]
MHTTRILEMPASDRPREKADKHGIGALTDAELLAIFIRTGQPGRNALAIASELIENSGGLVPLSRDTAMEIRKRVSGIGKAKSLELAAAFEIGKRLARNREERPILDTPERIYQVFGQEFQALRRESLRVILLDTKLRLVLTEEIALGSINECVAHPREIFRPAIIHSAYAVVLIHNHPSGDPQPSAADRRLTSTLREAAALLQINLIDHLILGSPDGGRLPYFSFRDSGLL